jgi:hypothetical protein
MKRGGWVVVFLVMLGVAVLMVRRDPSDTGRVEGGEPVPSAARQESVAGPVAPVIDDAFRSLGAAKGGDDVRRILARLESDLFAMPPAEASRAMVDFLADNSRNFRTGLSFTLRPDGSLKTAPALRVALLDWLGRIDPAQAAKLAEAVLAESDDPDEWAVCLRNKALGDPGPETRDDLERKAIELVQNPEWRTKPTAGYLEAFDVLVHTRATSAVPLLSELVSDRSEAGRATAHAAFLTLDRLVRLAPEETLGWLAGDAAVAASRPVMLAQLMARADLRDAAQRKVVEDYLLDPARSAAGLDAFAAIFPNSNYPVSDNLLTKAVIPSGAEIDARDRAAREVIEAWRREERFGALGDRLGAIRERLDGYLDP